MVPEINWLAVVLATVSSMVVGAIWYAKAVFGRRWRRLSGLSDADTQRGNTVRLVIVFVVSFFTAAVLAGSAAIAQHFYEGDFFVNAVLTSLILWIGFTAARLITHDLFDRRPSSLTVLNLAHELVTVVVMGIIIGAFGFPG
jgi:divalent metal cation (Fe/Co/Zn/Cd) transporter